MIQTADISILYVYYIGSMIKYLYAISMLIIITNINEEDVLFNIINNNDNIYNNKLYH